MHANAVGATVAAAAIDAGAIDATAAAAAIDPPAAAAAAAAIDAEETQSGSAADGAESVAGSSVAGDAPPPGPVPGTAEVKEEEKEDADSASAETHKRKCVEFITSVRESLGAVGKAVGAAEPWSRRPRLFLPVRAKMSDVVTLVNKFEANLENQ